MKIANYAVTTAFDVGHQAEPTQRLRGRISSLVEQGVAAIQAASAPPPVIEADEPR